VYTRVDRDYKANPYDQKKNLDTGRKPLSNNDRATQIIDELRPGEGEPVVSKIAPSAFWGTPLVSYLIKNQIDTLIVAGGVTSGCVRASVNDAFSLGYKICLVEDCVFDRGEASHKVNLWDMNAKQANVVGLAEALEYIGQF
jgi:nicotinamidase-related amidase